MQESDIIRLVMSGEIKEFGVLYERYVRKVYNLIYYKTHHRETAEDLTSQTFLKAIEKIGSFDLDREFAPWLYAIARNTVVDYYRTAHKHEDIEDAWDISDKSDIELDWDTRNKLKELRRYISKLPSIQRDIIILRVWDELSYKEIASIVGKSEGSCKMIFSRAIKELRGSIPLALLIALIINA